MATNNSKFVVKNGLAVGSPSIEVINAQGEWIGATGTLHGATGPQGVQGASGVGGGGGGVSTNYFTYVTTTISQSGNPGTGRLLWNNSTQTSSTYINVNHITNDDVDVDLFLALIQRGNYLVIQDSNDSTNYQKWNVAQSVEIVSNSYVRIPVTLESSNGTGTSGFANGHTVILAIISQGLSGATGPQGATGEPGVPGWDGATGASGAVGNTGATGPTGASGVGGGLSPWTIITSNTTAVPGSQYLADTSSGTFTVTLPSSPNTGDQIAIADNANFSVNNLTVAGNGNTIADSITDLVVDLKGIVLTLVYNGVTWKLWTDLMSSPGASGATGAWDYTGDLMLLDGSEDLNSGTGTIDLNSDDFTLEGDLSGQSGSIDLNTGSGSIDLLT